MRENSEDSEGEHSEEVGGDGEHSEQEHSWG